MLIHRKYPGGSGAASALALLFFVAAADARAQVPAGQDTVSYEALWKAAANATEHGEFDANTRQRDSLYARAERYARAAVTANPDDAQGHFELARALGRKALSLGVRDRVKYAVEVREHALAALALNPKHAGALHVLGVWNQQVMQLSGLQRTFARTFLGGRVFSTASWENAVKYLEEAVAIEPNRIVHRLDLGKLYVVRKRNNDAREQFQWILAAPVVDFNDKNYKQQAEIALTSLR